MRVIYSFLASSSQLIPLGERTPEPSYAASAVGAVTAVLELSAAAAAVANNITATTTLASARFLLLLGALVGMISGKAP